MEETYNLMTKLTEEFPTLTKKPFSMGKTVENRDIMVFPLTSKSLNINNNNKNFGLFIK